MLVFGDIHGNMIKLKIALEYKPEIPHIFTGDYVDSFNEWEATEGSLEVLNTIENDTKNIWLVGNHDIHYFIGSPFRCSGYKLIMAHLFKTKFEALKYKLLPVYVADGFIITHGGISAGLAKRQCNSVSIKKIAKYITTEYNRWLETRVYDSPIFNVPYSRGGGHIYGGVFWTDFNRDELAACNQVVGHTEIQYGVIQAIKKAIVVNVDSKAVDLCCFNTETKELEIV